MGVSMVASTVGGTFGTLILIFFSAPLARMAIHFFPTEYFALALLGLTCVATIGGKDGLKALVMAVFGLVLNTVGVDPLTGEDRFTFGIRALSDGFALIPALIGLFALSEILLQIESGAFEHDEYRPLPLQWPQWVDYWRLRGVIMVSSLLGTLIGVLPGAGATIAAFVAYDVAKRRSKHPELFGHGSLEGVAAAEAANSSVVGGALVPMLTLGIPGSPSTAVLISALMIHRVVPGPALFQKHPEIVYGLFASLLVANLVALVLGLWGCRLWVHVTRIDKRVLYPLILVTAIVGSYAVSSSLVDVACCLAFGFLGWLLRRYGYPVAPIVLGMILGKLIEVNLRQSLLLGGWMIFLQRWPSLVILSIAFASVGLALVRSIRSRTSSAGGGAERGV